MTDSLFQPWRKTPRLFRDMVITEKIDGTNAAIRIVRLNESEWLLGSALHSDLVSMIHYPGQTTEPAYYGVFAQSRKRMITPGNDNFGFAAWVADNDLSILRDLGPGLHYGEWWGNGIQRGYGLPNGDKRFSLFNTHLWRDKAFETPGLASVPVLRQHTFSTDVVRHALEKLEAEGSAAAPGFMKPEGVVVFHTAAGQVFKATINNDDSPKGADHGPVI